MVNKNGLEASNQHGLTTNSDLSTLSVEEIEQKIILLNEEIIHLKKVLDTKKLALKAADAFFKN